MNLFKHRNNRTVNFPKHSSLGRLYVLDAQGYAYCGPAQGTVQVPSGLQLLLRVTPDAGDLSGLSTLEAHDLDGLSLSNTNRTDHDLSHARSLSGLTALHLDFSPLNGSGLQWLNHFQLRFLSARFSHFSDRGISQMPSLPALETVNLSTSQVSDAAITRIAQLQTIKYLILWENRITCQSGESLGSMKPLLELYLGGTRFGDYGVESIKNLPSLTTLELERTVITDKSMSPLSQMAGLTTLGLAHTLITDNGIEALSSHRGLKKLALSDTQITDAGAKFLSGMPELEVLDLAETMLTDNALSALAAIPSLKQVNLRGTKVSTQGNSWLQNQLAGVTVSRGPQSRMPIPELLNGLPFSFRSDEDQLAKVPLAAALNT